MMQNKRPVSLRILNFLSILTALLVLITSVVGIFTPDFYALETLNWKAQSIGQDIANLFLIVPVLTVTAILNIRRIPNASVILAGVHLYLTYTFTIYCFSVHFNILFLAYCAILGLSFYSLLYFLYRSIKENNLPAFQNTLVERISGVFFVLIAVTFFLLWLSGIVRSILNNQTPDELIEIGLFTNPVHVLDLSVILPLFFLTGLSILRHKPLGLLIAPMLFMFSTLMNLTIAGLIIIMQYYGLAANISVAVAMCVLSVAGIVLLSLLLKNELPQEQASVQ